VLLDSIHSTDVNIFKDTTSVLGSSLNINPSIIEGLMKPTLHITISGIWPHEFRYSPQLFKPVIDDVGGYLGVLHDGENYEDDNRLQTCKLQHFL
jgi:hypothetical protein